MDCLVYYNFYQIAWLINKSEHFLSQFLQLSQLCWWTILVSFLPWILCPTVAFFVQFKFEKKINRKIQMLKFLKDSYASVSFPSSLWFCGQISVGILNRCLKFLSEARRVKLTKWSTKLWIFIRRFLTLFEKISSFLKLARVKPSSLFQNSVSDEEKKFCYNCTRLKSLD